MWHSLVFINIPRSSPANPRMVWLQPDTDKPFPPPFSARVAYDNLKREET